MPRAAAAALVVFAILYVLVIANPPAEFGGGDWRTTNYRLRDRRSELVHDDRARTADVRRLLFIVASGFSLIFGLMRVVNMAHGAFYLLGGYIAYEVQQRMTGSGFALLPSEVSTRWEWVVPLARRDGRASASSASPCSSSSSAGTRGRIFGRRSSRSPSP